MPRPRFCRNRRCENCYHPSPGWLIRNGSYSTAAHGQVQRYLCRACRWGLSGQSESMHYYAKRRLELGQIFSRLRGGSSQRDIGREIGCSAPAVGNAMLRLARQAMGAHVAISCGLQCSGVVCFDGLASALCSRDWATQITTLGDSQRELILAMTHCTTERGGRRTAAQRRRIERKRLRWRPARGALTESISLLVHELARFAGPAAVHIDTDEHPVYRTVIARDLALGWYRRAGLLSLRRTPGSAPRTVDNPLFLMNYIDRMIRHRMSEHTRESIALGRNATCQMHRMWIFAWDHNTRQPLRVAGAERRSRAELAGVPLQLLTRLRREFTTRRLSLRGLAVPESIRQVWSGELDSPPVRWRAGQKQRGPRITAYARRDLSFAHPHGELHLTGNKRHPCPRTVRLSPACLLCEGAGCISRAGPSGSCCRS